MAKAGKAKVFTVLPQDDWAEALHVALRKACDSTPSSIAWNAIYLLEKKAWPNYLDHVKANVVNPKDIDDLESQVKRASIKWRPYGLGHGAVILHCAFEIFSDSDWGGYVSYMVPEE